MLGLKPLIAAAPRIRSARVITGQRRSPATARRVRRRYSAVEVLCTYGAALALLTFFTVTYFKSANHVLGSPTRAQVTGTWAGDYGSTLVLRPDGTFTTPGLPQQVGSAAPVLSADGSAVLNVWSGHGTWTIGPGVYHGSPQSVIITVACGAAPSGCAGHPRTFDLQVETNAPSGGGGPALFYYLGNPHDLSNQYPFIRVP